MLKEEREEALRSISEEKVEEEEVEETGAWRRICLDTNDALLDKSFAVLFASVQINCVVLGGRRKSWPAPSAKRCRAGAIPTTF